MSENTELARIRERQSLDRRHAGDRQRENDRLRAEYLEGLETARVAKITEGRVKAEGELREKLQTDFMLSNPSASESDFERVFPRMRDEHLMTEAREAPEREKRALRATGNYRF